MSIQSEINRIAGAKSDIADAIEDKDVTVPSGTKLDGMANLIRQIPGGSEKLNSTQAADAYDPTATYAVGDKVSYAGNVYSCISAISTPEAWDSTHWDQVDPIQDQVDDVRNTLNSKADKSDLASLNLTGTTNTTGSQIDAGTYFYLNDALVKAKTDIANGATFTDGTNYEAVTVCEEITALNNSVVSVTYNANTNRNVESNRTTAMKYLIDNYFSLHGNTIAIIRYESGYYSGILSFGNLNNVYKIIEFCQGLAEKIIYWEYAGYNDTWTKYWSI